jgi:hypothetical protein
LSDNNPKPLVGVLQTLVGIARLRKGPEDLPVSVNLLILVVVASVVPDVLLLGILPAPFTGSPVALIAIGIATTLLWYAMILRMAGRPERFLQTLTAIFGFQLVMAPLLVFSGWFFVAYQQDPTWQLPAALLRLAAEMWALVVLVRILRSATAWPTFSCVVLALAGELLAFLIVASLFPQPAAVAAPV